MRVDKDTLHVIGATLIAAACAGYAWYHALVSWWGSLGLLLVGPLAWFAWHLCSALRGSDTDNPETLRARLVDWKVLAGLAIGAALAVAVGAALLLSDGTR